MAAITSTENAVGITLDLDALIAAVRKHAAEHPDFVYEQSTTDGPACAYQRRGEPSCILGRGMADVGVPVTILAEFDDTEQHGSGAFPYILWEAFGLVRDLGEAEGYTDLGEGDDQRILWLTSVQQSQDAGQEWGHAIEEADTLYPLDAAEEDEQ